MTPEPVQVVLLQHAESEPPGAYSRALADLAVVTTVRAWEQALPDDFGVVDAIVAMGVRDTDTIGSQAAARFADDALAAEPATAALADTVMRRWLAEIANRIAF